jgi:hypothetical protein
VVEATPSQSKAATPMKDRRTARRYDLLLPVIVGAELDLTMILPAEVTGSTEVFIRATGKVVRVDKRFGIGNQKVDVAAVFETHEIVRNKASIE